MGITIATVLATAILMAVEASKLGMSSKRDGFLSMGPAGWFICGIGCWIVAFPAYLYYRSKYGVKSYIFGGLASAFVFLGVAVALNIVGSGVSKKGMSKEQIGETTTMSMQQAFDTDAQFKEWQLTVTDVQVLKQGENRYQGIAKVVHDGTTHDVPVDLTVDGLNVMWKTDQGAFLFVAQKEFQKLQNLK
jgi:phosphotransferase system  glucose/maltose/N-acetylglucosamine-specific IIC component